MADVDRSSGTPIVSSVTNIVVVKTAKGFDVSWDATAAANFEYYYVTRNDGKTYDVSSTILHDTYEIIPLSTYTWSVSVKAGLKLSVPTTSSAYTF